MSDPRGIGDNSGVSPEVAIEAMRDALKPWQERRLQFETKAKVAVVDDVESAKVAIDFIRMARALREQAENLLADVHRPYKAAAAAASGIAEQFMDSVDTSIRQVQSALSAYNEDRKAKAAAVADKQRSDEAALAAAAAKRDGQTAPALPAAAPRRKKAPTIRTDLGGKLIEHDRWRAKVVDPTKVPAMVLRSPRVVEAIRMVSQDLMKNGIEVEGVEKEHYTSEIIQ